MRYFILIVITLTAWFQSSPVLAKDEGIGIFIEKLTWEEANKRLPKYSEFTVMDVDTGKRFRVQRRAGNRHADVQPLTPEDTKIMKEIYNNKWSWRRKAIIVIHGNQWIAASMHGMPHGAGTLKNNFPGHFCIHFYNSTTHRTNAMDLSHQLMILKAAGELEDYLSSREPSELMNAFVAGLKQKAPDVLSIISIQDIDWNSYFPSIQNIKLNTISHVNERRDLSVELQVDMEWIDDQSNKENFRGEVELYRVSPLDPWKIDSTRFLRSMGLSKKGKSRHFELAY